MRYICLNNDNMVVSVRMGEEIAEGEIQSDVGDCGQIMQSDGTFLTPVLGPVPESQLDRIENTIDLLLLKQEGIL